MKLKDLIETELDLSVTGISYDSREVQEGSLFVAIRGFAADGHDFALAAQEKGAVCVLCERAPEGLSIPCIVVEDTRAALARVSHRFYGDPSREFTLIGVTGTNGKTTVTYLMKEILEHAGHTVGLIGTNQNMIGGKVLPAERTTPEALELARLFRQMADEGCDCVVMEASSHALDLHRVASCDFDLGIFTNLTQDHLDFHHTMEAYYQAKKKLFSLCRQGVVNADDEAGARLAKEALCAVTTYGINGGDIRAAAVSSDERGVHFRWDGTDIFLGIPGHFSVYNALAAIGGAAALGIEPRIIQKALGDAKGVKGRAELVPIGRDFAVMIDYAHTPDGLKNILESARGFTRGRLIALFGCGGDRDRAKRPMMGRIAGELADFCIITSDNPRTEEPAAIIRDILAGMKDATADYIVLENRRDAIAFALKNARAGDVVVLAGKGHETYQVLSGKTIRFDEREVIEELLKEGL